MAAKHIFRENLNYHTLREKKSTNMGKNKYGQYFTIEPLLSASRCHRNRKKDSCNESIEYILYFLNSKHVFNWLTHNGIIKGAIVEFSEAPIASIPYRMIDWNNPKEVAIHNERSKIIYSKTR